MLSLRNACIILVFCVVLSAVEGYLGPRYGKRLPETKSHHRLRGMQLRSQAYFYPGPRYGGKRSSPNINLSEEKSSESSSSGSTGLKNCMYMPYSLGLQCIPRNTNDLNSERGEDGVDLFDSKDSPISTLTRVNPAYGY